MSVRLGLLVLMACSRHAPPESPPSATAASVPPVATSAVVVPMSSAPAADAGTTPAATRPKAGFVGFVDGAPWSGRAVGCTAVLQDNAASISGGSAEPREISVDVTRPEDGERILLHVMVTPDLVGKHAFACNATHCSPVFDGNLYPAHHGQLLSTKEPSAIEVLKYETLDANTKRISLWFDLKLVDLQLEALGGKGRPVHVVGAMEDVAIVDVGEPVGLVGALTVGVDHRLLAGPVETQTLSIDHLPASLRPPQH